MPSCDDAAASVGCCLVYCCLAGAAWWRLGPRAHSIRPLFERSHPLRDDAAAERAQKLAGAAAREKDEDNHVLTTVAAAAVNAFVDSWQTRYAAAAFFDRHLTRHLRG